MRRKPAVLFLVAGLALALAGAAAAANGGFTPPTPRSPNAGRINDAYYLILGLTGAIFLLVEGALVLFIVRFRSRGRGREVEGPQIRGNTRLELAWTVVPVLILAAIAGFVFYKLPGIKNVPPARAAGDRFAVKIKAYQYYWQFTYPSGKITIDDLRVPAGRVVTLEVTSADVAHSWWIPALGGKIDAIPGRTTRTWFRASRPGVYRGQCAELCGIQHTAMTASVHVVPVHGFAVGGDLGAQEFNGVCAKCHGFKGEGGIGPKLVGNPLLRDRAGLEDLLENGRGKMPAVGKGWGDTQLDALIAYFERNPTLTGGAGGG